MLDQLLKMIQQSGQGSGTDNQGIPNENNEAIFNEAHQFLTSGLQDMAGTDELNNLVTQADNPSTLGAVPSVQNLSNNFAGNIMKKFGLDSGIAKMIAAAIIPMILSKLLKGGNKSTSGGGFDIGDLLSNITGGSQSTPTQGKSSGGIMDTLSNLGAKFGLDKDGDGDVDLNDITKMFK